MLSKRVQEAVLGGLLAVLWLAVGCGTTYRTSESETHFLAPCQEECGGGLECICGICTKTCDSAASCHGLAGASCETIGAGTCADEPVSVCDVPCASDGECEALGPGYTCTAGSCRWTTELTASDVSGGEDTGAGGTEVGDPGAGGALGEPSDTTDAPPADTTSDYPSCSSSTPPDDSNVPEPVRPPSCDDPLALGTTLVELFPPTGDMVQATSYAADWNGDGQLDLATATPTGVSVLLGGGDGTLGPRVDSPMTLGQPGQIDASDLNHDGVLDLVLTGYGSSTVNVLFGDGSGAFTCGPTYTTGALPVASAIHDFSGDGFDDIGVLNQNDGTVQILLGAADGGLREGESFRVGLTPSSITAADFDGDQVVDLAITLWNDATLVLFIGSGDGRFRRGSEFATGHLPTIRETVDLNADGYLDLVIANGCTPSDDPSISVLLGTGYGFAEPDVYPSQMCVLSVSAGDLNSDGIVDLLGTGGPLIGKGDGTFFSEEPHLTRADWFALFDWDADGRLDLARTFEDTAYIELGNGDGTFGAALESEVSDGSQMNEAFALADFDGDGTLDSAFTTRESVVVALGAGDGTFSVQGESATGLRPVRLGVADLNGDDRVDLVTTNMDSSTVSVLLGAGDGSFVTAEYDVGMSPSGLAIGDLNGDDVPDIVVTNTESASVSVLLGTGDGSFVDEERYPVLEFPGPVFLNDLNGDGALDAILGYSGKAPTVLFGIGDGSLAPYESLGASENNLMAVEDLNRDGSLDLVTHDVDIFAVELGRDAGGFEAPKVVYTRLGAWGESGIGDLDADGHFDLMIGDTILRGTGDGSFHCAERHSARGGYLGDVNGDGALDVVSMSDGTISVALQGF